MCKRSLIEIIASSHSMLWICVPSKSFIAAQGINPRHNFPCFEGIALNLQLLSEDCFLNLETERQGHNFCPGCSSSFLLPFYEGSL